MDYSFKNIQYHEDDRAQRYLNVFEELGPGQLNVSYVNSTEHIVAWHKHNIQTDYWVCVKGSFKVGWPLKMKVLNLYTYLIEIHKY